MVDAVLREWLRQVLGVDATMHGYGEEVQTFFAIFYADNGLIAA